MSAKLYSFSGSIWASIPRIAVIEKQITDIEIVEVDLPHAENYSPSYLKINKSGTVPSLIHPKSDTIINDSTTICEFLDSTYPEGPALIPADETKAAQMRDLIKKVHDIDPNFITFAAASEEELTLKKPNTTGLMSGRIIALTKFSEEAPQHSSFYAEKIAGMKQLLHAFEHPEDAKPVFDAVNAEWVKINAYLDEVEALLASHGGPFLIGEQYTLADTHFTCAFVRFYLNRRELVFQGRPHLQKYWETIQTRESFKKVYAELH